MERFRTDRLVLFSHWLALLIAFGIALLLPLGYFLLAYRSLSDRVSVQAEVNAQAVTALVAARPEIWAYQLARIEEIITRGSMPPGQALISVFDHAGRPVLNAGSPPAQPVIRREHPLYDSGRVVGRIEVSHSVRDLALRTGLLILVGVLLGGVVYRTLRQLTRSLYAERVRHSTTIESLMDGYAALDARGRLLKVNTAFCSMTGWLQEELEGRLLRDLELAGAVSETTARIAAAIKSRRERFETRWRTKTGELLDIELSLVAIDLHGSQLLFCSARNITERKRGDSALRDSEQNYRTLADSAPALIWASGTDGQCNYFNQPWLQFTGRALEQEMGSGWTQGVHPDDLARCLVTYRVAFDRREPYSMEYRLRRHDGDYRWVRDDGCPRHDHNGEFIGYLGYVTDITERRRAEDALHESNARFQTLVEQAGDGFELVDEQGHLVDVNNATCAQLGYTRAELLQLKVYDIAPVRNREKYESSFRSLVIRSPITSESIRRRKDGSTFPVEVAASVVTIGGRQHYLALVRDITERKRAEESLRESDARFRTLVEQAGDGFELYDEHGRIFDVNKATCVQLGYTRAELLQLEIFDIAPELRSEAYADMFESLKRQSQLTFPSVHRRKDGTTFPVEVTASVIRIGGRPQALALVRDITERKRLEEAHLQSQKLESLGTLAGGIAHDFNNILAAIRGNADLAAKDVAPDHIAAQSLEEIRKASARASELVRRIMAFGRPTDARQEVVNLGAVVGEVLKLLRSTLPAGISLRTEFASDAPHVLADAGQIHEAIVNLTTNAAYAIGPRAGSIRYRLEPVQVGDRLARTIPGLKPGRYVCLTVTDSGCGMDAATLERVFDAFYTTKPVGEGTGLGLSMVHGIMKSHGGAVTVESTPGKGSSFHLYFPATREMMQTGQANAPAQSVLTAGQRVLYVDDEDALVFLANRVLTRLGHSVSGFTDPNQALEAFRAHPQDFDIVVTDLSMPYMSGFDFARQVLALRPGIPVLMTTGYIRAEDQGSAAAAGISQLILKPVTVDELGCILDATIRGGELNRNPSA